jgi:hypothetical protein
MGKNVLIPQSLLDSIIELIESSDIENHDDYRVRSDCYYILEYLVWKQQKVKLRHAYSKISQAETQATKDEARKLYLQQRQLMRWERERMVF